MTKKDYLFVIDSPLQLICANEYINEFNIKNYKLIIRNNENINNNTQLNNIIKLFNLNLNNLKYIYLGGDKKSLLDYLKFLFLKINTFFLDSNIKVVIGNFDSPFQNLYLQNKKDIILLDDGTKTLFLENKIKKYINKNVTLYTFFDIEKNFNNNINIKIIKNNFSFIKEKLKKKNITYDDNKVLIAGTKIVELNLLSSNEYIEYMKQIKKLFSSKKIYYIPHRNENIKKLNELQKIGIIIEKKDYPLELIGFYENILPNTMISFLSTSLITLNKIYNINSYYLKFNYDKKKYSYLDVLYKYIAKNLKELKGINEKN